LLRSIPAWEDDAGRPFLVHGESILQMLMETVSAADQENKRKPARAGSVPPRATTPVGSSHGYVPGGSKTGVVTPAVRTSSQMGSSHSVPNKRQKLGENGGVTPVYAPSARAPLGGHRGVNMAAANTRAASPTKLPTKTPTSGSLTRTTGSLAMVMPKPGTQHHALGHGRIPSSVIYGAGVNGYVNGGGRSVSTSSSATAAGGVYGRTASAGYGKPGGAVGGLMKKATRAKRESFKPRPSTDTTDLGMSIGIGVGMVAGGKRWGGGFTVNEEDEY